MSNPSSSSLPLGGFSKSEIIKKYPIGTGLDAFRIHLSSACEELGVPESSNATQNLDDKALKHLASILLPTLINLSVTQNLPSPNRHKTLSGDLAWFYSVVGSDLDEVAIRTIIPILDEVNKNASDEAILNAAYNLMTHSTPPPRQLPYPYQTPTSFNTSSFVNTSENRKQSDGALKAELDSSLYIDVPDFFDAFFGEIPNLSSVADTVFRNCRGGEDPLHKEEEGGWRDWPKDANEEQVLQWLKELVGKFLEFAKGIEPVPSIRRKPVGQPNRPLPGSATHRKLNVGFVNDTGGTDRVLYDWSQILVPGEFKSNPDADRHTSTWLDLSRYAREVLTAQDTRRFVIGFTLCGSIMRLWEFDRLGGLASCPFDINAKGLRFVSAVLGYLWMNNEQLGFDPTISKEHGRRYINITRNGKPERLVIDELIKRHSSVAGRATTCWKAHREGDESRQILVVKDSWQYSEREEEGELVREATEKGVMNVARYYHHETVHVGRSEDDVNGNIRKGLNIMRASNAFRIASASKAEGKMLPLSTSGTSIRSLQRSRGRSIARKRSSTSLDVPLSPSKRTCSSSSHKQEASQVRPNRVHRRVILRDYGKGIHRASSRVAMLSALEGNIIGHESLRELTGRIQSDISIGNLLMNEDDDNPSWPAFMIDLDLAFKENPDNPSGAPKKTGTKAFMSIRALEGEKQTFMDDLESIFWLLFWICVHYTGPNGVGRVNPAFEWWNFEHTSLLATFKAGTVSRERAFIRIATEHFSPYFRPLIPWVNRLRRTVFPGGSPYEREDRELYSRMREVLKEAMDDHDVKAGWTA